MKESAGTMTNRRYMDVRNKGTVKLVALRVLETKRVKLIGIKGKSELFKCREWSMNNFEGGRVGVVQAHVIHASTSAKPSEEPGIRRFGGQIVHGLAEGAVLCSLDFFRESVKIESIAHGFTETKKNASASIGDGLVGAPGSGWKGIDAIAEDTEETEVRFIAGDLFVGRGSVRAVNSDIVEAEEMVKSIGQKFWGKISSGKHGTDSIPDCLMRTFTRAILVGVIGLLIVKNNL